MLIPDSFEEQDIPRASPGAGLSEIANPQAFGAGVAQTADYGAQILTRAHYDAAQQANKVAALDKHNAVEAWTQKAWLDPQNGLRNQNLGAQAPAATGKLLSDFDNVVSTQRSALANDQQREIFDAQNDQLRQHLTGQTDEYAGQQLHQHAEGVYSAGVGLAHNAIANNPGDAEAQIAKIQGLVTNHAALNGFAPGSDESKFMVQGAVSDAHLTAIQALNAQNRPQDAATYLADNRGQITDAKALALAESETKAGTLADDAQTAINANLHVADDTVPGGSRFATKDEFLSGLNDKDYKDNPQLLARIRLGGLQQIAQHEAAENDKHDSVFQGAIQSLDKGTPVTDPAWNANVESLPKPLQDAVWDHADKLTNQHIKMVTTENQHENYGNFFIRDVQDPGFLRRFTGAQIQANYGQGQVSSEDYNKVLEAWKRSKGPDGAYQADGTGPSPSEWQDVSDAATRAGLDPSETGKFSAAAQEAIREAQDANKNKALDPEKRQQILAQTMAEKVFVPGPPRGFNPWQDLKDRFVAPAPNGQYIPTSALSDDDWSRIPQSTKVALAQRHAPWNLDAFKAVTATKPKDGK